MSLCRGACCLSLCDGAKMPDSWMSLCRGACCLSLCDGAKMPDSWMSLCREAMIPDAWMSFCSIRLVICKVPVERSVGSPSADN
jgi:hypothetical protein